MIDDEPTHEDYMDRGAGIFFGLVILSIVIGALYLAFTKAPGTSKTVVLIIIGAIGVFVACYGICYGLGYLAYHLPEQVEKWK